MLYLFYSSIFIGSFLLFLIQPIIGKIITPVYGGTSQVWSICLLFFQITLLAGYTITFLLNKFNLRIQTFIYTILLFISLIFSSQLFKIYQLEEYDLNSPINSLLWVLFKYISPIAITLSTISTCLQNWHKIHYQNKSSYHLYSLSNIGSLLALIIYPSFLEGLFPVLTTLINYKIVFYLLVFQLIIICFILQKKLVFIQLFKLITNRLKKRKKIYYKFTKINTTNTKISNKNIFKWLALSAAGTLLLSGFTTYLTQDISPIPFLWILPLIIYLLSFIISFADEKYYNRFLYILIAQLSILLLIFSIILFKFHFTINIILSLIILFCLFMFCNGEIFKTRPKEESSHNLPVFYLLISLGGVIGSLIANIIAPLIFKEYLELFIVVCLLLIYSGYLLIADNNYQEKKLSIIKKIQLGLLTIILTMGLIIFSSFKAQNCQQLLKTERNFYGVIRTCILEKTYKQKAILHGRIVHGSQLINSNNKLISNIPTTYYNNNSGIGLAYKFKEKKQKINLGVIGLGVGTIAAYGRTDDNIDFYEIDPKIKNIAENDFTYLKESKANTKVIMGDGRLMLKKKISNLKPENKYDILVIDAFNGDSVPVHLLTKEAINIYTKNLKKDGLLLFHISNRYLDLDKPISNITQQYYSKIYTPIKISSRALIKEIDFNSVYLILSPSREFDEYIYKQKSKDILVNEIKTKPDKAWTDDYNNLFSILKFRANK